MGNTLYIVIPCYNEEQVLPLTAPVFRAELQRLTDEGLAGPESRILLVDDGSRDRTWSIICGLSAADPVFTGISLSRNRGHQNALLAGLLEARGRADCTISLDCDGQDDPAAMREMLLARQAGSDVVYGVRRSRETDRFSKRFTARCYYRLLRLLGADVVYDHADYRLLSARALDGLAEFGEVNLFLRGMIPLVGFPSSSVYYDRLERQAGSTHYPLGKMLALAFDGITSLSIRPLRLIAGLGAVLALLSFVGVVWSVVRQLGGHTVAGWASLSCIICLMGGVQLLAVGVLGEYIGKLYLEAKHRPRYLIAARSAEKPEPDAPPAGKAEN